LLERPDHSRSGLTKHGFRWAPERTSRFGRNFAIGAYIRDTAPRTPLPILARARQLLLRRSTGFARHYMRVAVGQRPDGYPGSLRIRSRLPTSCQGPRGVRHGVLVGHGSRTGCDDRDCYLRLHVSGQKSCRERQAYNSSMEPTGFRRRLIAVESLADCRWRRVLATITFDFTGDEPPAKPVGSIDELYACRSRQPLLARHVQPQ